MENEKNSKIWFSIFLITAIFYIIILISFGSIGILTNILINGIVLSIGILSIIIGISFAIKKIKEK